MADAAPDLRVTDDAQLRELTVGSAIPLELVAAAQLFTVKTVDELGRLTGWGKKRWSDEDLPALAFPYYVPGEPDPEYFAVKPRAPKKWTDEKGKEHEAKYVRTRGQQTRPYLPPNLAFNERRLLDPSIPKIITEGEKKALAACGLDFSCIGLAGVDNWRARAGTKKLHALLKQVASSGPDVFICYDSDRATNLLGVRRAETELAAALGDAGARVFVMRLPNAPDGSKQGLDDYIAANREGAKFLVRRLMEEAKKAGPVSTPTGPAQAPAFATALTDLGNAERLKQRHGHDLRWCAPKRSWFAWELPRWTKDETGEAERRAHDTVKRIYVEAADCDDRDTQREIADHAHKSQQGPRLRAMIEQARPMLAILPSEFDTRTMELNCPNGIVDLETGKLFDHDRARMHSRVTGVAYDPGARSEAWDRFLHTVTGGDKELQAFLQRAVGYSLTADTSEEKLFLVFGHAQTGKSTFVRAVTRSLGMYAKSAGAETFLQDKNNGHRPRPDLVELVGARMVVCVEMEESSRFNEALVKSITGKDTHVVRGLYSDPFEYSPSYKLWLAANDVPDVQKDSDAMWRRIVRVPFDRDIPNPDPKLKDLLFRDDAAGRAILAWAVAGCMRWQKEGLGTASRVAESTRQYRQEMESPIDEFFRYCVVDGQARVTKKELRKAYEEHCEEAGAPATSAKRFGAAVRKHLLKNGITGNPSTAVRNGDGEVRDGWRGIRLRRPTDPEPDSHYGGSPEITRESSEPVVASVVGSALKDPLRARARESELSSVVASEATTPLQPGLPGVDGDEPEETF